ncbi:unnamed protein product, partial [marine sediment metagenome]
MRLVSKTHIPRTVTIIILENRQYKFVDYID